MKLKQAALAGLVSTGLTGALFPIVAEAQTAVSQFGLREIIFNGVPVSTPYGFVAGGTTYMPIWYVMAALKQIGVNSTWDGTVWNLTTPAGFQQTNNKTYATPGSQTITLDGKTLLHVSGMAYEDPSTHHQTTYMPIWDIQQILLRLGFQDSWDGYAWKITHAAYTAYTSSGQSLGTFPTLPQAESAVASYLGGVVKDSAGNVVYTPGSSQMYTDYSSSGTAQGSYATLTEAEQALSSEPLGTVKQTSTGQVVFTEPGFASYEPNGQLVGVYASESAAQASLSNTPGGTVKNASGQIVYTQPGTLPGTQTYLAYTFSGSLLGGYASLSQAESALSSSPLGVVKSQSNGQVVYTQPGYVAYTYAGQVLGLFSQLAQAEQAVANSPVGVVKDQNQKVVYLQPGYVLFSSSWQVLGQYATLSQAQAAAQNFPGSTIENQNSVIISQGGGNYTNVDLRYPAPVNLTASVINNYLSNNNSPLNGLGSTFIRSQNTYGVDANYLVSHAILESAWGKSQIALAKNNLFGYGAYDSNPGNDAGIFPSEGYAIRFQGWEVRNNYLDPGSSFYVTPTLTGMNVNYATDPNWARSIGSLMNQLSNYAKTPFSDYQQYTGSQTGVPAPQSSVEPSYGFNGAKGQIVNLANYQGLPFFPTMQAGEAAMYSVTLQNGSSGSQVATVQNVLNQQDQAALTVDGVFGTQTENAVKTYQQNNNLPVTGVVDFQTWSSMVSTPSGEIPASTVLNIDQSKIGMSGSLVVQWYHVAGYGWVDSQYVKLSNVYRVTVPNPTSPTDTSVQVYSPQNPSTVLATLHAGDEVVAASTTPSNGYYTVSLINQTTGSAFTGLISTNAASLTLMTPPNAP